jgi:nucleotide-binding universal stress UspA family protein
VEIYQNSFTQINKNNRMKTIKMTKVLITLDFNPTAQKVAEEGFSLAKTMGAEVILLHVIVDPIFYSSMESAPMMGYAGNMLTTPFQVNSVENVKKAAQHFLDKSKHHLGDEAIQTLVKEGDFADSILKVAKDLHVDIIVMGSHSRRWLDEILMGSVTEKVLHHTTIPLLIIPTKKPR